MRIFRALPIILLLLFVFCRMKFIRFEVITAVNGDYSLLACDVMCYGMYQTAMLPGPWRKLLPSATRPHGGTSQKTHFVKTLTLRMNV
jgi:hypothetical protein